MSEKRRRSERQKIEKEQLKSDPESLLSWGIEDPTLHKLETYRLYQSGYAVADIAEAFGISHGYLYEMWGKFKEEGTEALVDKRWGSAPRKRTTEKEADVLRAKAMKPELGDSELASKFGMDRSTVYRLLKEHGLQDLHLVLCGSSEEEIEDRSTIEKKKGVEIVPCEQSLLLTLLNPLECSGYEQALSELRVRGSSDNYSDEQIRLSLVMLSAWGVSRVSHINDQSIESWGIPIASQRRPDGDTVDQYLETLLERDEASSGTTVVERQGQISEGGLIDRAQQSSLRCWVEAGLTDGDVWYFDDHVVEYTGKAELGKTKHGTKHISVKGVTRYTLHNGLCSLSEYFPQSVSYAEAMRHLVSKANSCLSEVDKIRKLSFDRAGWDAKLLSWLQDEQQISPITWVKRTPTNVELLDKVSDEEFVELETELPVGKDRKHQVVRVADTRVDFPHQNNKRVVILETQTDKRIGIYTTAVHPSQATLDDQKAMTTLGIMNTMRFKQRIENSFKVDKHEMGTDAIPTHKSYTATITERYDIEQAQKTLSNAKGRLEKYTRQQEQQQQLHHNQQLNQHQLNLLNKRTQRLHQKAEREIKSISEELKNTQLDENSQTVLTTTTQVLDVRKWTLINLFKSHARVALKLLARRLGMDEAGPDRLRRSFLAFGDRVEFDHDKRVATVFARPFPRALTQKAYERLCREMADVTIMLNRNGVSYRVQFSW